jgi:23S rRNA (cytosine1962-C5)-methyltransferase
MEQVHQSSLATIVRAIQLRGHFPPDHCQAERLFNGFAEGFPELAVDLYARTVVLFNFASDPQTLSPLLSDLVNWFIKTYPWLQAILIKERYAKEPHYRTGVTAWGSAPDHFIVENGVRYAIDLLSFQDSSLFLDTRNLRTWIKEHAAGKRVLNTFAYTGSLGVAALAGGARSVMHLDRSLKPLEIARQSCRLNQLSEDKCSYWVGDFFEHTGRLRREGALFDMVILDPPFFSTSFKGRVDMVNESQRMINKIRPLAADGGILIVVNNAVFLSGGEFLATLQGLCAGGYMAIDSLIPVPEDFTGYPGAGTTSPPVDPAPFNHSTKIAVLSVRRKDGK